MEVDPDIAMLPTRLRCLRPTKELVRCSGHCVIQRSCAKVLENPQTSACCGPNKINAEFVQLMRLTLASVAAPTTCACRINDKCQEEKNNLNMTLLSEKGFFDLRMCRANLCIWGLPSEAVLTHGVELTSKAGMALLFQPKHTASECGLVEPNFRSQRVSPHPPRMTSNTKISSSYAQRSRGCLCPVFQTIHETWNVTKEFPKACQDSWRALCNDPSMHAVWRRCVQQKDWKRDNNCRKRQETNMSANTSHEVYLALLAPSRVHTAKHASKSEHGFRR